MPDGTNPSLTEFSQSLTYQSNGNVSTATEVVRSTSSEWQYAYDYLNRLTTAKNSTFMVGCQESYGNWGNRYSQSAYGGTGYGCTSPAPFNANTNNQDPLLLYDAAGNTTRDALGNTYVYDAENRITAVTSGWVTTSYTYRPDGQRATKLTGSNTYYYSYGPDDTLTVRYESGSGITGVKVLNQEVWLSGKHLGTITGLANGIARAAVDQVGSERVEIDGSGNIDSASYSQPFGDGLTTFMGSRYSELYFTGKERDTESGDDYFGARYYSSNMGRFLSPDDGSDQDPLSPQSWNLYSYVGNNPLTNTDPNGHDCVTQTRTSDTSESVSVSSGGCGSGGGTYVPGTVSSVTAGADGHSIDIGYTPYSDGGGGAVENVSAASNGPKMDEGAVNPEGEGQLVGIAVGGPVGRAAGAAIGGVLGRIGSWLGMGAGAAAGDAAGEVTAQFALRVGGAFNRVFQTAAGPIEVDCEITVEGSTAVVKDLLIYPYNSSGALDVGTQELRAGLRGLQQELKQQGFDAMRVEDTIRTTGANPGRAVNFTTRLR